MLNTISGLDLYLLDQIQKGRVQLDSKILDAGCGGGGNLKAMQRLGFTVDGFDPREESIIQLKQEFPELKLWVSSLEEFKSEERYDFVICNAVLHFAQNHRHFDEMFEGLVGSLAPNGVLFIRTCSNFATSLGYEVNEVGLSNLPDGSLRYLLTNAKLNETLSKHNLQFVEPIKTVNVNESRSMTNLVLCSLGD
jgi:tellurite methyltransferase